MSLKKILDKPPYEVAVLKILYLGSAVIILSITPNLRDPINAIKFVTLLITAAWLIGYLLFSFPKSNYSAKPIKVWLCLMSFFVIFLSLSTVMSDNLHTSIIGVPGRLNGFLQYFSLVVISTAAALVVNFGTASKFLNFALTIGSILSIYGVMQSLGKDFIQWNNPYNSVITTAGNPNFSAAIMAIVATITYGSCLNHQFNKFVRIFGSVVTLLLVYTIYLTDARQGLLSIFIGFGFTTAVYLYSVRAYIGRLFTLFIGAAGTLAVLGILQIGPMSSLLYKSSVTVRGYYFKAGLEMFQSNPWFGVGLDRYGSYFREYRDLEYPLKYGFAITSNNAHNVPIQFFATAGIFVGVIYLAIIVYIFIISILAIKKSKASNRIFISTLFAAWLVYQAQSYVSIDSPGASVLGWLLSGALVGLYVKTKVDIVEPGNRIQIDNKLSIPIKQPLFSSLFVMVVIVFGAFILRGESLVYQARAFYNPDNKQLAPLLKEHSNKIFSLPLMNDEYKREIAMLLIEMGLIQDGMFELEEIIAKDPRNEIAQEYLATNYYLNGDIKRAIQRRDQITNINPWDARNYLILGQLYRVNGDLDNMLRVKSHIIKYFPNSEQAVEAKIDLVS